MAKKVKKPSQKSIRKNLVKEIEVKIAEVLKDYHKKAGDKKFSKEVRKAGKFLSKSLAKEKITVVHKKTVKVAKVPKLKKDKKVKSKKEKTKKVKVATPVAAEVAQ